MTGNVKISDKVWREILTRVRSIGHAHVKVGIIDEGPRQDGGDLSNAEIAAIHEFGAPGAGIPPRPFMRTTFTTRRAELVRLQEHLAKQLLDGRVNIHQALALLGAWAAGAIKTTITRDGHFAANAASTIKRKGSSKPLVDTGQMVGAITFAVVA